MEKAQGLVSVVIPSYNRRNELPACLDSVLRQTYENIEVIIADDGSTDGSFDLFRDNTDARVRYLRYEENRGACYARNFGAEHSCGEFIAFQDSDDIWHEDKLRRQLAFMEKSAADLVFCGMDRVSIKGQRYYYPVHDFVNGENALHQLLLENRASTQTMLMRREVWEKVKFDESFRRFQDWDFILRAAKGYKIAYQKLSLVRSSVSQNSISASVSSISALERLYEKHKADFDAWTDTLAAYYRRMGNRLRASLPREAADYYKKAITLEGRMQDRLRYLSCLLQKKARER